MQIRPTCNQNRILVHRLFDLRGFFIKGYRKISAAHHQLVLAFLKRGRGFARGFKTNFRVCKIQIILVHHDPIRRVKLEVHLLRGVPFSRQKDVSLPMRRYGGHGRRLFLPSIHAIDQFYLREVGVVKPIFHRD